MSVAKTETLTDMVARLTREHHARMRALQAEGPKAVAAVKQRYDDMRQRRELRRQQQRDEDRLRRQNEDAVTLANRRESRTYLRESNVPSTGMEANQRLADTIETDRLYENDPQVVWLRSWICDLASRHGIDMRWDAAPQLRNGSAVRSLKLVTTAPVQSLETAAVAGHEMGHVLGNVDPNAPKKPAEVGPGTICVSDELNAWRWVLETFPIWELSMHIRMTECLASYRSAATEDEAKQIDALCSPSHFTWITTGLRLKNASKEIR